MCDNSCYFEPTFTLNGIPTSPCGCQAPTLRGLEGKAKGRLRLPTWLRLGVKVQEPAFWEYIVVYYKRKSSLRGCFFIDMQRT